MLNQNCRIGEVIFYCSYFQILFTFLYIVYIKIEASSSVCQKTICFQTEKNKSKETKNQGVKNQYWLQMSRYFQRGTEGVASVGRDVGRGVKLSKGRGEGKAVIAVFPLVSPYPKIL